MSYSLLNILEEPLPELRSRRLKPVTVAVIDSGVDSSHEVLRNRVCGAWEFLEKDDGIVQNALPPKSNNDDAGHGTAVASIVAKIAPNARILDFKVLNANFTGSGKVMIAGLRAAIDSEAKIINMSLACLAKYRDEISGLLEQAYQKHKIVVASKRNIPKPDDLGFPAELSSCISVDNHSYDNNPFFIEHIDEQPIEFAAHGEHVLVARNGGGYYRLTGTSFATPTVSGNAALLLGAFPELELFEIKTILKYHSQQQTFRKTQVVNPLEITVGKKKKSNGVGVFCPRCRDYFKNHEAFSYMRCPKCGYLFALIPVLDRDLYGEVISQLKRSLPPEYVYHSKAHTQEVVANIVSFLPHYPKMSESMKKCLITAALLHDCGYRVQYDDNERFAADYAGELLPDYGYTPVEIALIQSLIMATGMPVHPVTIPEKILCDADVIHVGTEQYWSKARLLRRELQLIGRPVSKEEWRSREIDFLSRHKFFQPWLEAERKDNRRKALEKLKAMSKETGVIGT